MDRSKRFALASLSASALILALQGCKQDDERNASDGEPDFPNAVDVGPPDPNALKAKHLILDMVGIERDIHLVSAHITKNGVLAYATMIEGKRYIVYDRRTVPWPDQVVSWHSTYVMAHEIGHHLATHIWMSDEDSHAIEMEADRFAGYALSRLGATQAQATSFYASGSRLETHSHPSASVSLEYAREGWQLGERMKRREWALHQRRAPKYFSDAEAF